MLHDLYLVLCENRVIKRRERKRDFEDGGVTLSVELCSLVV